MNTKITQWTRMGDLTFVKENSCSRFEYKQAALEGCGFINIFTIVHPRDYIIEINDIFVGVISEDKYEKIMSK